MIRPSIQDVGGGQAVAFELLANAAKLKPFDTIVPSNPIAGMFPRLALRLQASKLNKLCIFKALAASMCPC